MKAYLRPTESEIADHAQHHVNHIWTDVGPDWTCPICKRDRIEVMVLISRKNMLPYWSCQPIGIHHDHGCHPSGKERFERSVICGECNNSDGRVKRKLKLPANFSFSPTEIATFITCFPHRPHAIDYSIVLKIFNKLDFKIKESVLVNPKGTASERIKRSRNRKSAAGFVRMETRLPSRFVGVFRERCAQARQEFLAQQQNEGGST